MGNARTEAGVTTRMNNLARPIVVGVDDSSHGQLALRWAVEEAALRDLDVRVVRAVLEPSVQWPALGMEGIAPGPASPARDDRGQLDAAVSYAVDRLGPLRANGVLVPGSAGRAILDEAAEAALVVVGSGEHSTAGAVLLGSVASAVSAHAPCPVVVVRGSARQGDGPVLVGVDGSSLSDRAVAFAFDEAARCRSALEVVNVWHPLDHIAADRWSEAAMQEHRERRLSRLEESVAGGREKYPEVPVRLAVADGRPAATLVELSERAALVVVGSRGHGGIAGLLLGSVSQNLLHHAHCSVAVVRNGD